MRGPGTGNRFNGFSRTGETVETVSEHSRPTSTPLKRGVNESRLEGRGQRVKSCMSPLGAFACALCLLAFPACAQSPVSVTVSPPAAGGLSVPADFVGLSFGMRALLPNRAGAHFFSPTNQPLVTLFRNIGVRHLRLGGTSVEWPATTPIPGPAEIDDLFAFARAAQVQKVLYSFRLLETNANLHYDLTNAVLAKYIWDHYRAQLDAFAIGNEPDHKKVYGLHEVAATNFPAYLAKWRRFAAAITQTVPEAKFSGPDACSGRLGWPTRFAQALKPTGLLKDITEHFYVGGAGRDVSPAKGIDDMLSAGWLGRNRELYKHMALPVLADGVPYRFTEANDHFSGGVKGASETFAGALWALDFLHWWAAHGAQGVDFHNTQWVANDVITHDAAGALRITPKGYGFKAFELGGYGTIEPAALSNPKGLNLTAYAVRTTTGHLLTIINKEHGPAGRVASLTLTAPANAQHAEVLFLTATDANPAATTGITLGGDAISSDAPWQGKWSPLSASQPGRYTLSVPALSAAILRITVP